HRTRRTFRRPRRRRAVCGAERLLRSGSRPPDGVVSRAGPYGDGSACEITGQRLSATAIPHGGPIRVARILLLVTLALVTPALARVSGRVCKETCPGLVAESCAGLRKKKLKRCRAKIIRGCKRGTL